MTTAQMISADNSLTANEKSALIRLDAKMTEMYTEAIERRQRIGERLDQIEEPKPLFWWMDESVPMASLSKERQEYRHRVWRYDGLVAMGLTTEQIDEMM